MVEMKDESADVSLAGVKIKKAFISESILYTIASAGALLLDFSCYSALIRLFNVNYQIAAVVGFLTGLCFIYGASVKVVFRHRAVENRWKEKLVFAVTGVIGLMLTSLILYISINIFHLSYELAKLSSVGLVFIFNFSARKVLLFSERRK